MQYITIHNDKMPGALKDSTIMIKKGMGLEEVLKEVSATLTFQRNCVDNPEKMGELYGD